MSQGNFSDDLRSKFFKVYLPGESGDDLELPISFNSCLPNILPKYVTVRSIYGKSWRLVIRKCGGDVEKYLLVDGWKRIVKDEDLKCGDFLAFEFDGSRLFNFCIYEHETMCKRLKRSSGQSKEVKVESASEEETQASDDVFALDEDDDDDSEYRYADDNDGVGYADDDAATVEEEDDNGDGDDNAVDNDADDAAFEEDDNDFEAVDPGDDAAFDDDDDERQYLDDRLNPSFTTTLNPKKQSQLLIPARVIKDYDLHFPEKITLVDPLVNIFGTLEKEIKIQTNGSVFVKDFGSIFRRNNVKTTDKMIFEIKKTGNDNLVQAIKIHIISG